MAMMPGAHLEVWLGPPHPATSTIELREKQTLVVGRATASALMLKDGRASGKHLTLEVSKEQVFVCDHSTNGSYLNGHALEKGKPAVLSDGDVRAPPTPPSARPDSEHRLSLVHLLRSSRQ